MRLREARGAALCASTNASAILAHVLAVSARSGSAQIRRAVDSIASARMDASEACTRKLTWLRLSWMQKSGCIVFYVCLKAVCSELLQRDSACQHSVLRHVIVRLLLLCKHDSVYRPLIPCRASSRTHRRPACPQTHRARPLLPHPLPMPALACRRQAGPRRSWLCPPARSRCGARCAVDTGVPAAQRHQA